MKKSQRVEMIREVASRLEDYEWTDIDLLLREHGQPQSSDWHSGDKYGYVIAHLEGISNPDLADLHSYLGGESDTPHVAMGGDERWTPGRFRLFLSHISAYREFVGLVKLTLEKYGIEGFVAHADIEPSKEWQDEIEIALITCDALAAFLHEGFTASAWTEQEVGWALGRGVVVLPVILDGGTPYGLMGRYQGLRCGDRNPHFIARMIFRTLMNNERTSEKAKDALVASFPDSRSYDESNERARLIREHVSKWTPERLDHIERALRNPQVSNGFDANPIAKEILQQHRPPQPSMDEVPF